MYILLYSKERVRAFETSELPTLPPYVLTPIESIDPSFTRGPSEVKNAPK